MAGAPPPPGPPKLGYKGRREREEEERQRREAEEAERHRQEAEEAERRTRFKAEQRAREEQKRERYLTARKVARGVPRGLYGATAPGAPPTQAGPLPGETATLGEEEEALETVGAPAPGLPALKELPSGAVVPEVGEREEAPPAPPQRRRLPPRPPKSPDMRPVWAGFLLVGVGTAQLLWGLYTMARAPWVGEGRWADAVEWASFAAGFSAAVLGAFALRGGMWSFRKERHDRVLWGAVCATICFWALWVPWVVGFIALLIVRAARDEYYPHYDPARDAPEWARPPRREPGEDAVSGEDVREVAKGEGDGGEQAADGTGPAPARG
jgi:hypothetical protein